MYLFIHTYNNALLRHEQTRDYNLSLVTLIEALESDIIFGKFYYVITFSEQQSKPMYQFFLREENWYAL